MGLVCAYFDAFSTLILYNLFDVINALFLNKCPVQFFNQNVWKKKKTTKQNFHCCLALLWVSKLTKLQKIPDIDFAKPK